MKPAESLPTYSRLAGGMLIAAALLNVPHYFDGVHDAVATLWHAGSILCVALGAFVVCQPQHTILARFVALPLAGIVFALQGATGVLNAYPAGVCFMATYIVAMWVHSRAWAIAFNVLGAVLVLMFSTQYIPFDHDVISGIYLCAGFATLGTLVRLARNRLDQAISQAERDFLTGLMNRRAFVQNAPAVLEQGRASNLRTAVMVVDIDHFKSVNDELGHEVGDQVLSAVADTIKDICRGDDIVARIGGEEFVILANVPGCAQAQAFAERVRRAVAQTAVVRPVSVSIGVVCRTDHSTISQLVSQADAALYEAKSRGRNQVVCASNDPEMLSDEACIPTGDASATAEPVSSGSRTHAASQ